MMIISDIIEIIVVCVLIFFLLGYLVWYFLWCICDILCLFFVKFCYVKLVGMLCCMEKVRVIKKWFNLCKILLCFFFFGNIGVVFLVGIFIFWLSLVCCGWDILIFICFLIWCLLCFCWCFFCVIVCIVCVIGLFCWLVLFCFGMISGCLVWKV